FDPPPNPRLRPRSSTLTCGNFSLRDSTLPSVDPLSTTITPLPVQASITDGRYLASKSFPFQFGITMLAFFVGKALVGQAVLSPALFPSSRVIRSAMPNPAAASRTNTGDSTASGRPFTKRQSPRPNARMLPIDLRTDSCRATQLH